MSEPVSIDIRGAVAVVTIDNPPVNAFSHHVRVALQQAFATLDNDQAVEAIVITCAGKSFSAGADVRELGAKPIPPSMGEVMRGMDAVRPLLVAAIHGQALGGGLEAALVCDYRVASADARFGLPEVTLGLMPGGGGTQRLPRLIGIAPALDFMIAGKPVAARAALASGLIDVIAEGDVVAAAVELAREKLGALGARRRLSEMPLEGGDFDFAARRKAAVREAKLEAAGCAVDAVQAATTMSFADGIAREAELFQKCRVSTESQALRYLFAAERTVARVPGMGEPRALKQAAVIGAGTMGRGVTIALLDAGLAVALVDADQDGLDRGVGSIRDTYASLVKRGRLSEADVADRLSRLSASLDLGSVSTADLIIECVFEDMAVKQDLFRRLGTIASASAVLATNTSALDVNAIARASGRAPDSIGMHFFSPANIMRLVEVVKGEDTSPDALATAMAATKRMGKIGVLSGVCDGFIGNRMFGGYLRQANALLLEGAAPEQIDGALKQFGMAMGPHAMGDMAGLDIQAAARRRRRAEGVIPAGDHFGAIGDRLVEAGRFGLKSGKGIYRYEAGSRDPLPDPDVAALIREEAERLNVPQRKFTDDEIILRCILPLVNEGARIVEEKIALAACDVDVVCCNGYGFPRSRGGPMFYGDTIGLQVVVDAIRRFNRELDPRHWRLTPLLERLAAEGGRLSDATNRV